MLEQPDALLREGLVPGSEPDERPGVARTQRTAAIAAGHQPPLDARAVDAQRPRPTTLVVGFGGHQIARAQQVVHACPIATQQPGRLGHTERRILVDEHPVAAIVDTVRGGVCRPQTLTSASSRPCTSRLPRAPPQASSWLTLELVRCCFRVGVRPGCDALTSVTEPHNPPHARRPRFQFRSIDKPHGTAEHHLRIDTTSNNLTGAPHRSENALLRS